MKKLILSLAVVAIALGANAQSETAVKKSVFSIGLEGAFPMGTFGDTYSVGIGGSLQYDYNVDENLAITGQAGVISYSGKSVTTPGISIFGIVITPSTSYKAPAATFVPVLAGIKYTFGSSKVYGSGQLGVAFSTQSGGGSAFTYAPGVGYKFSQHIDALLKYTGMSVKGGGGTFGSIGLRVAYSF